MLYFNLFDIIILANDFQTFILLQIEHQIYCGGYYCLWIVMILNDTKEAKVMVLLEALQVFEWNEK